MDAGALAVRLTIWSSVLAWVVAEWRRTSSGASATRGRRAWTVGALAAVVHAALAFQVHHAWSHAAAVADTARRTAAVTGLAWGGGVYLNYAFLAAWSADVFWWWLDAGSFRRRPRGLDAALRAFLWFMFVNGTFVFVCGPLRWVGAGAALAVAFAWYRGRGRRTGEHG